MSQNKKEHAHFRPSAWAIKNPLIPFMLLVLLIIMGIFSYRNLAITQFPNVSIPVVQITATQPGTQPVEMERQVTSKIESAVNNVPDIKNITSTVNEGVSNTIIEFRLGADITKSVSDVKDKITAIRSELPSGMDEPIVSRFDVEGGAVLTMAVESEKMDLESLTWLVDDRLSKDMSALKGAAKVDRQGGIDPEIQFIVDLDKLKTYGISISQVSSALKSQYANISAGYIQNEGINVGLSVKGEINKDTLPQLSIKVNGNIISLQEIGSVVKKTENVKSIARVNGKPAIILSLYKSKGTSEVSLKEQFLAKKTDWEKEYGVTLDIVQDQVKPVQNSYHSTVSSFIEGTILAVAVVFLFLKNNRATLIAASAIPFSAIPAFLVLDAMGFTLNLVSLLALSLVSGILVDDAIVEIENIIRHKQMGKSSMQAALDAADEIGLAVVATSAVIIAVFIPVSFMDGVVGQYFKEFGITVAVAVFFSLLVARFVTPVLAAYLLKDEDNNEHVTPKWIGNYEKLLGWVIDNRKKTIVGGLGFIGLSVVAAFFIPTAFVNQSDNSTAVFQVKFNAGTTLEVADNKLMQLADSIKSIPEIRTVLSSAGDPKGNSFSVSDGTLRIVYVPKNERSLSIFQLEKQVLGHAKTISGVELSGIRSNGKMDLSISLVSKDADALYTYSRKLEQQLQNMPELQGVTSSLPKSKVEWNIIPNFNNMAKWGITTTDIAKELRLATQGESKSSALKYKQGDRELALTVSLSQKMVLNDVKQLPIAYAGGVVPLEQVADVALGTSPATLSKLNQRIQVNFQSNLADGVALGTALNKIKASPLWKNMPKGVSEVKVGDAELLAEMFASFGKAMLLGILFVYATLVWLFNSLWRPFVILWSLPLSIGGALIGLAITGQSLGISALIGVLMLMGIVGKNAILLVDYAMEEENKGLSEIEAIKEAGKHRVQPIIMTTIAMIAGMIPVVLGLSEGSEFRVPMGVAVVGGLLTSTMLSLLFVPALYVSSSKLIDKMNNRFKKHV